MEETNVKPSISSHSNSCMYEVSYEVSQMFCFRTQCIQNKTFETSHTGPRMRLWITGLTSKMEVDVDKHQGLIANNVSFIASAVPKNQNQNTRFLCVDFCCCLKKEEAKKFLLFLNCDNRFMVFGFSHCLMQWKKCNFDIGEFWVWISFLLVWDTK